jgi:hypothetical protein
MLGYRHYGNIEIHECEFVCSKFSLILADMSLILYVLVD